MMTHAENSVREFIDLHHAELEDPSIARIGLFSDYVGYCHDKGYAHHSHLMHFCKECAALVSAPGEHRCH
jgi:hypothetical protein